MGAYAASKAGVEGFTDTLRVESRADGVGVGCAYFGAIDTDLVRGGMKHASVPTLLDLVPARIARPASVEAADDDAPDQDLELGAAVTGLAR